MSLVINVLILVSACASAWFWWKASGTQAAPRDANRDAHSHDLKRIIVTINRGQTLNSRPALATAISAEFVAVRFFG